MEAWMGSMGSKVLYLGRGSLTSVALVVGRTRAGDERFLLDSRVVFWPPSQLTSRLGKYGIPQCPQDLLDRLVLQSSSLINLIYTIIPI